MYKVLLVDDEKAITEGLKQLIVWEDYGFEIIGTAESGEEGYKKILSLKPDVVITDMRMEDLTGLELLQMISQNYPTIKSVVISGYEDFSYARGALQYGAVDYLLKPVKRNELINLVISLNELISKDGPGVSSAEADEENTSILRSRFLIGVCKGEISDREVIEKEMKRYNLDLISEAFRILIIDLDFVDIRNENDTFIKDNVELIRFACANIIESTLESCCRHVVFYSFESRIYVMINQEGISDERLKLCLKKMQRRIFTFVKMPLTVGVSQVNSGLASIPQAYGEAEATLKYKLIFGRNTMIYHEDVMVFTQNTFSMPVAIEKKIVSAVLYGSKKELKGLVDELFNDLFEQKVEIQTMLEECIGIIRLCHHSAAEMNIDISDEVTEKIEELKKTFESGDVENIKGKYTDTFVELTSRMLHGMSDNYGDIIIQICDYINNNFHEEINLNKMSEKFFISPSYISKLFKEHTDGNFIDYLIRIRISEAKKLLAGTDLKVYEVSERVGYSNPKYFSQLFMKNVGMTPREYRESLKS